MPLENGELGRLHCSRDGKTGQSICDMFPFNFDIDCDLVEPKGTYGQVVEDGSGFANKGKQTQPPFRHDPGALCAFGTTDRAFRLDSNHYCCDSGTKVMAVKPRQSDSGWNLKSPYPRCCTDEASMSCSDPKHVSTCAVGTKWQNVQWWSWCAKLKDESGPEGGRLVHVGVTYLLVWMIAVCWAFTTS